MKTATQKIRATSGQLIDARYVRHLRTLTGGAQGNTDVDLYRTANGRLVVCLSPDDARATPWVDPDSTPEMYGVQS